MRQRHQRSWPRARSCLLLTACYGCFPFPESWLSTDTDATGNNSTLGTDTGTVEVPSSSTATGQLDVSGAPDVSDSGGEGLDLDAGLILHLPFTAVTATETQDATGNHHGVRKMGERARWVTGLGGEGFAVEVMPPRDPDDMSATAAHVMIPQHAGKLDEALESHDFSISLWFRPTSIPADTSARGNDEAHAILVRPGYHEGLVYVPVDGKPHMRFQRWTEGGDGCADLCLHHLVGIGEHHPNEWHHVVVRSRRDDHVIELWVDGRYDGETRLDIAHTRVSTTGAWQIGVANVRTPGQAVGYTYDADARVDEVRVYDRWLEDDEVQALCSQFGEETTCG